MLESLYITQFYPCCYSVPYEDLRQRYLQFSVYDFDRFSRHDLIGHVVLKGLLETTDLQQEIEYTMNILCAPQVSKFHLYLIFTLQTYVTLPFSFSIITTKYLDNMYDTPD